MKHLLEYDKYVEPSAPINESFFSDLYPAFFNWLKDWFMRTFGGKPGVADAFRGKSLPPEMEGEHMLYVPHQQGGRGSAKLYLAAKGNYNLSKEDIGKIKSNMPSSDPGYKIINDPKSSSKEKALAYFRYWKNKWSAYSKDAKSNINLDKHKNVKKGIVQKDNKHPKFFSDDFLTTVAWIESRFNPLAGQGKTYKGLFQIGNDAFKDLKKAYSSNERNYVNKTVIPMDTVENPQMGNDYLKWSYDRFKKNLEEIEKGKTS